MTGPMLQFYSFKLCPFAHRVRLALAEKGVLAEAIEIDLKNKPASFVRISPCGRVPLLLHGEAKLWESAVISEYLDEVFPDPPLMPASLPDRAHARIWVKFVDDRLYSATHRFIFTREEEARRKLAAEMVDSVWFLENELMAKRPRRGALCVRRSLYPDGHCALSLVRAGGRLGAAERIPAAARLRRPLRMARGDERAQGRSAVCAHK
ncbi:glutathione S-transferase N-terminal domain-containing protein [Bradyrhizobium sp. CCGB01]|nr:MULTISPECIES: glutathione S-transferase N-terminal domain-containing protein [unclassified Bradyrhizobium]MCP3397846.1 glutathione S-transferase N-terminal domain-containing protein [Bradyrhizobium sp. CCGB20]MCP3406433.1 glutathione S-transferase N-terminal domain-containing protein [Bradyrhizobium sp. CCGB01]